MSINLFQFVAGVVLGLLAGWVYLVVWRLRYTSVVRRDAVLRSQAVTSGKVHEQLVPYLPSFCYNPKDVRFLGSPVDLVVFDGLSEGHVRQIIFVEVKTGRAGLTPRERLVRDAVQTRKVEWAELRVPHPAEPGVA